MRDRSGEWPPNDVARASLWSIRKVQLATQTAVSVKDRGVVGTGENVSTVGVGVASRPEDHKHAGTVGEDPCQLAERKGDVGGIVQDQRGFNFLFWWR